MLLEKFLQKIEAKNRTKNTIALLTLTIGLAEKYVKKPLEDASFEEILSFIEHVKIKGLKLEGKDRKKPLSKNSLFTIENNILQFYRFCFNETDDPKHHKMIKKLKDIKIDKPKNKIRPQDILFPEEAKKLINIANLERDRCIVSVMYEAGMRIGELMALTNDMVEMDEAKQEVIFHIPDIEGLTKTGSRDVLCTDVYGYVQDWMKCNTSTKFMPLSDVGISNILKKLYKLAKINKPSNAHMMRHSSITNACILKMQPNQISMRYWGIPNSNMLQIYIHLSETMLSSGYRDAKGLGNGNDVTVVNPLAIRCVVCGRLIQSGSLCIQCNDNAILKEKLQNQENEIYQNNEDIQILLKEIQKMKEFQAQFFKDQKSKYEIKK